MPTITVRLKDETHRIYMEMCRRDGVKASSLAREMIEEFMKGKAKVAPVLDVEEYEDENKHRVYSWLYESEITAIKIHCNRYKGTQQSWIAGAVRSVLKRVPAFNEHHLKALEHSNYQMNAANTTLQKLTKRLSLGNIVHDSELKEAVELLASAVKTNEEKTRSLAWDCGERWYQE